MADHLSYLIGAIFWCGVEFPIFGSLEISSKVRANIFFSDIA